MWSSQELVWSPLCSSGSNFHPVYTHWNFHWLYISQSFLIMFCGWNYINSNLTELWLSLQGISYIHIIDFFENINTKFYQCNKFCIGSRLLVWTKAMLWFSLFIENWCARLIRRWVFMRQSCSTHLSHVQQCSMQGEIYLRLCSSKKISDQ